jgi:hypothetical protein
LILPPKIDADKFLTVVTDNHHRKNVFHVCVEGKQEKNRQTISSVTGKPTTDEKPRECPPVATTNPRSMNGQLRSSAADSASTNQESSPSGHAQICSFLIERYKNAKQLLTEKDSTGNTPLHLACKLGREDILKELIKWIDPNDPAWINSKQRTPLHECAKHGHLELVRMMLDNYNQKSQQKLLRMQDMTLKTAIHLACKEGSSIFMFQYSSFYVRKLASNQLIRFLLFHNLRRSFSNSS